MLPYSILLYGLAPTAFATQIWVGSGSISDSDSKSTCSHVQEFSCNNDICDNCAGAATGGRCRNGDNSGGTCPPGTLCNKPTAGHCLENTFCSPGKHAMPSNKHFRCISVKGLDNSQPVIAYQNADCTGASCFMISNGEFDTWGGSNRFWNCIDTNPASAIDTVPCRSAGERDHVGSTPTNGQNGGYPLGQSVVVGGPSGTPEPSPLSPTLLSSVDSGVIAPSVSTTAVTSSSSLSSDVSAQATLVSSSASSDISAPVTLPSTSVTPSSSSNSSSSTISMLSSSSLSNATSHTLSLQSTTPFFSGHTTRAKSSSSMVESETGVVHASSSIDVVYSSSMLTTASTSATSVSYSSSIPTASSGNGTGLRSYLSSSIESQAHTMKPGSTLATSIDAAGRSAQASETQPEDCEEAHESSAQAVQSSFNSSAFQISASSVRPFGTPIAAASLLSQVSQTPQLSSTTSRSPLAQTPRSTSTSASGQTLAPSTSWSDEVPLTTHHSSTLQVDLSAHSVHTYNSSSSSTKRSTGLSSQAKPSPTTTNPTGISDSSTQGATSQKHQSPISLSTTSIDKHDSVLECACSCPTVTVTV